MEEILNMWTKDLEKYTREFHKQAAQVADWDKQLIDNGNKVMIIIITIEIMIDVQYIYNKANINIYLYLYMYILCLYE